MAAKVLIAFYSSYGHVHRMARSVVEGAESVRGAEVRLRRIPELEEARRAMSAQEWYVKAQEAMADIPEATQDDLRGAYRFKQGQSLPLRVPAGAAGQGAQRRS